MHLYAVMFGLLWNVVGSEKQWNEWSFLLGSIET